MPFRSSYTFLIVFAQDNYCIKFARYRVTGRSFILFCLDNITLKTMYQINIFRQHFYVLLMKHTNCAVTESVEWCQLAVSAYLRPFIQCLLRQFVLVEKFVFITPTKKANYFCLLIVSLHK